jgi:[NiFe] hydrogenase assembly HybE family chaperone
VIVTPWFMNLTVVPAAADLEGWAAGRTARLGFPSGAYDFAVSDLLGFGLVGTCPLFSTMLDFTDHEAAQLAAKTIADAVFEPEQPAPATTVSRRQLLGG